MFIKFSSLDFVYPFYCFFLILTDLPDFLGLQVQFQLNNSQRRYVMRRLILLVLPLFLYAFAYSQPQKIDPDFRIELSKHKAAIHKKRIKAEKEITPNQQEFDIIYYDLNLTPDPTTAILYATVEIVGKVVATSLDHVELNFWDGMNILAMNILNSPGGQIFYTRGNDLLTINLDKNYTHGEEFDILIAYSGKPQNSPYGSFGFDTHNNQPMIWTHNEPYGARGWYPCKDVPSDKADSVDIRVTVPNNLIVASNGTLRETKTDGNHTTYWWHENYPIVTYLVSLAIYPYTVYYDQYTYNGSRTMPIHFYMFEENATGLFNLNAKTKNMIAFFAEKYGEYPFIEEKYGHADFLGPGAMEHQTCTSFSFWNEWVIAHELAHQWWGDLITCESFHHIWLNEGFATYSESLWYEHLYGPGGASDYQMNVNLYLGSGTVYVEDPENEDIFDVGLSYDKGSWVLHMLRHVVGDEDFFNILQSYYRSDLHHYGTATTEEFQAICEQVYGKSLEKFFHQWIYEEYYPRYSSSWTYRAIDEEYQIQLTIRQEQTNHIFWMPLDITVSTISGDTTIVILDSLVSQTFEFFVSNQPTAIEIDKYNWVLKVTEDPIIDPTFDQGILLVNGVSWETYGSEIYDAYENKAFWGGFPISFWDCFYVPLVDYPSTLPDPLGHGRIPAEILGQFSTIIWIGNNYGGDLGLWQSTSILSYLEAGGNVLLLTRRGQDFINFELQQYLGITWAEEEENTINNCIADYSGLENMTFLLPQTAVSVFKTEMETKESILLFKETVSFEEERGLGVWKNPAQGGQFVFINGRPYRYSYIPLQNNIEYILDNFFGEKSLTNIAENAGSTLLSFELKQNYPNPFNPTTTINYQLPISSYVELSIYNLLGEKVVTLVSEKQNTGNHQVEWDARGFASGVYLYRINADNGFKETKKLILLK